MSPKNLSNMKTKSNVNSKRRNTNKMKMNNKIKVKPSEQDELYKLVTTTQDHAIPFGNDNEDETWSDTEGKPLRNDVQFSPDEKFNGKNFAAYKELLFLHLERYSCIGILMGNDKIPDKSDNNFEKDKRNE